jgi:hypothetical protein
VMEIEHQLCRESTKEEHTALSDLGPMVEEAVPNCIVKATVGQRFSSGCDKLPPPSTDTYASMQQQ